MEIITCIGGTTAVAPVGRRLTGNTAAKAVLFIASAPANKILLGKILFQGGHIRVGAVAIRRILTRIIHLSGSQMTIKVIIIYSACSSRLGAGGHCNIQLCKIQRICTIGHIVHIFRIRNRAQQWQQTHIPRFGHRLLIFRQRHRSKKKNKSRPRAWAPNSMPVSTTNWATLSLYCRALTQRPFQARELCLGQGCAKYGANAKRNNKLGTFSQKASRPCHPRPANTTSGATLFPQCCTPSQQTASSFLHPRISQTL